MFTTACMRRRPAWAASDIAAGIWDADVALDGTGDRDAQLSVELSEHCLSPPPAAIMAQGGTPVPVSTGQTVTAGTELEISTGNPSSVFPTITDHRLLYGGTAAAFGRITLSAGSEKSLQTWSETATGRDGQAYTSSDLSLTVGAVPCEAAERLVNGTCEPCPTYEQCSSGSLETRTQCEPRDQPANARDFPNIRCLNPDENGWSFNGNSREFSSCGTSPPSGSDTLVERSRCINDVTVTDTVCVDNRRDIRPPENTPCVPCPYPDAQVRVNGICEACPSGQRQKSPAKTGITRGDHPKISEIILRRSPAGTSRGLERRFEHGQQFGQRRRFLVTGNDCHAADPARQVSDSARARAELG